MTQSNKFGDQEKQAYILEQITHSIGVGIVVISPDYKTLWANEVVKDIFGPEVEGKCCYATYNKRDAVCPNCGVKKVFETGAKSIVHEQKGQDGDGNPIWSQIIATPIYDKAGNIESVMEVVVPITEQKITEERMLQEKRFSESLIRSLPGVMYLFNERGQFLRWNENFEKVTGYAHDEVKDMSPLDFIDLKDQHKVHQAIANVFQEGKSGVEASIMTKDGRLLPYFFTGVRMEDDGLRYVVGVGLDITERINIEQEKQNLIAKLEANIATIKQLSGLLPICAHCKNIRDDKGYWQEIESYITKHAEVDFSHGICPKCAKEHYPEFFDNDGKLKK